eukprot:TRINITY_DN216_c0_g1_i1.p1 TRINITY_DN216_c0_g1~~TRINITY_DN216_c0_g1_i1.p1  ORF type:complete len:1543 (-),score=252.99 TRINITY_DN216_c0_g1_i1:13996-18465(-)
MESLKESRSGISHSTGPVIGNNIYLNIFNAYSIMPQTPGARPPSAKVLGRKVENQMAVHISDSALTDRAREVVCLVPSKKPKGPLFLSTPRAPPTESRKNTLISSARDFHPAQSKKPLEGTKKLSQTTKKFYDPKKDQLKEDTKRIKGKTQNVSPAIQTARLPKPEVPKFHLGKRAGSDSDFQLTNEMKEMLGLTERKVEIPYSVNRFQGRYNEVVPQKYKEMKEMLEREKRVQELKKEEARLRVARAKDESEKIRKTNQALLQKPVEVPILAQSRPQKERSKLEHKKKSADERLKEIGLEFILHFKRKKSSNYFYGQTLILGKNSEQVNGKEAEGLFNNEQIRALIRDPEQKKPQPSTEEKERRKILVEEQKREHRQEELSKKQAKEIQEQVLRERVKEVKETQRKLREEVFGSKQLKRKTKRKKAKKSGKIKITTKGKEKLVIPLVGTATKPKVNNTVKERIAESDTEAVKMEEPRQHYKKMQRQAIARKAEKIREQQAQRLNNNPSSLSPSPHGNQQLQQQPVLMIPSMPRTNPRGLSTSSYAAPLLALPLTTHTGDITAPVMGHLPEEEKHRLKESWRERMHDIYSKLQRHESKRRPEESKELATDPQLLKKYEEEKQSPKKHENSPGRAFDPPTPQERADVNNNHNRDVLSNELERIDEQFEIHGENTSERKEVEEFNKEVSGEKRIERSSAEKEAEDYGHILQSMEDMEKDPLSIHPAKVEEEKHEMKVEVNDFDSDNEKEIEPQAILYTAREEPKESIEEKRLKALEEETKNINEQLRKELAEKDNIILSQALRETKLHQEYQEMLAKQTKDLMQKVLEVTHSMQSAHSEQMNSVVGKLCDHLEKLAKSSQVQEPQFVTKSLEPSPAPKPRKEITASEPKRAVRMDEFLKSERTAEQPSEEESSGSTFERTSFTEMTYKKLKEILRTNRESREIRKAEEQVKRQYQEKITVLERKQRNGKLSPKGFMREKEELEKWYEREKRSLEAFKKKLVADALKKTANLLEVEEGQEPSKAVAEEIKEVARSAAEEVFESTPPKCVPANNLAEGVVDIKEVSVSELPIAEVEEYKETIKDREIKDDVEEFKEVLLKDKLEETQQQKEKSPKEVTPVYTEPAGEIVADEDSPKQNLCTSQENSADTEPKANSDIEWMMHIDSGNNNNEQPQVLLENIVKPSTGEPDDNAMVVLEKPSQEAPVENVRKLETEAKVSEPETEVEEKPEDHQLAMANTIVDEIYAEILTSLGSDLFPKREFPITDLIEKPPEQKPRPPRGINTALWNIEAYIDETFREVLKDPESFIASLSIPLNRDPLFILGQIQNEDNDYFEAIEQIMTQPVLPVELYLALEHMRKVDSIDEVPKDPQHENLLTEWSNIHNKCIFDAVNDALDYYRPYGLKGPPLPWSKQVRELTYRNGSVASAEEVLLGAKAKVLTWAMTAAGTLQLPEESDINAILAQLGLGRQTGEKSRLDQFREERLETMLTSEVNL